MPGGRGTLLDISSALNNENPSEIAEAVKLAIDSGYRISNVTMNQVGAAYGLCDNINELADVWCHAIDKGAVDWGEY